MKAPRGITKYVAAIAVVALLALAGASLAAAQRSEPRIPFTITGNVFWYDFWYEEMGGTRTPQLVSIYHLKEGTFREKKDGYHGGVLLAETVTDADGNYSITLEADGMHRERITIRVDGFSTETVTRILANWHEDVPLERNINWPTDWRPEDGNNHLDILKELTAAKRGTSLAAAQGSEPKIPFTIAGNVYWQDFWYDEMGGVRVSQLVSIYHLKEGTFTSKNGGYHGGVLLAETVTDADGDYSITLEADGMHREMITIRVDGFSTQTRDEILADWHEGVPWEMDIYWPGDWRPEDGNNDHAILRRAAQRAMAQHQAPAQPTEPADGTTTAQPGATEPVATTAPQAQATQAQATPTATPTDSAGPAQVPQPTNTPEPTSTPGPTTAPAATRTAAPAQPQQQEEGTSGGCAMGNSGSTDLSAVMFGGTMLTGLGLLMVRRRKG